MQAGRSAFFVSVQKRFCFSAFKRQRSWIACLLPQGCPEGLGWTGKNHPRYAPVFFPAKPCTIPDTNNQASKKSKYWLHGAGYV